jgi:hypothetical protein
VSGISCCQSLGVFSLEIQGVIVLTFLKSRIVGGPEFSDPQEDALIFELEVDDLKISGSWLQIWGSIHFTEALASRDSAFYDSHLHYIPSALAVHRRVLEREEANQNGAQ